MFATVADFEKVSCIRAFYVRMPGQKTWPGVTSSGRVVLKLGRVLKDSAGCYKNRSIFIKGLTKECIPMTLCQN